MARKTGMAFFQPPSLNTEGVNKSTKVDTLIRAVRVKSIVFGKKKFSDIIKEIYDNQNEKKRQVSALISELKPLISDIGDATLVVPLIKEYMEIGVKNDEQLIKMATIVQRALQTETAEGDFSISDEEKEQLLAAMEELQDNSKDEK